MSKFQGYAIPRFPVIRQNMPLEITEFSGAQTYAWRPKIEGTSGVDLGNLKHFLLSPVVTNIRTDTSHDILGVQTSKKAVNRCFHVP